uniref:Reverse transcriptase domain-containing protein n=1 Tax=Tanacetum cinerariifolium TaxID=118510 RepID=A0A6L2LB22_TANCI|nr:reverse transcriptase domain-containing protein [Tanacetum cinerariifolium]
MKSNEIMIKSMQNQINVLRGDFNKQEENLRRNLNNDMRSILGSFFQNLPSTLGTLSSYTVPNPKGEMKAVTTRSGLAYEGPSITTSSPLEKVDEKNTEEILDRSSPTFGCAYFNSRTRCSEDLVKTFNSSLLANKDKLFELAKFPLNENCSAKLLKKLPEKLRDSGKFLIPCNFTRMEVDYPSQRSPEDIFIKVGKFYFLTDFVVVDFEADPRVPLILRRSFLRTGRALIDVYGEEITLRYNPKSSSPTLASDDSISESDSCKEPIVKSSSPTHTPFEESDFFLEEIEDFRNDDSIPTGIENYVYDPEGDILFLEKLLNKDPFQLPPMDLKLAEESKAKSSVEEPPELELKELPSHLEYAFLEDSNKLPVIIAKNLKDVERESLINVLKSRKRAIAWKISDIKGIDQRFCTHKNLMEDDYKPAVQSQRRVNPKIHDVIKKEVIKLLDSGMIYPISDSPWVSPIHCVPKKGGMTVVANDNNELIPTRLVTGWRVSIDYRKLNDATRKDHFPLPFMDQMLERLAGNVFYCFLDGFSGYFQIPIDPTDQEKTTFTCPYGAFAYQRMPFGLCNAPGTFQRCMMSIFHDMIEKTMEVFMDNFLVFGDSFSSCLTNLDKMLNHCEETNLVLNWEKCHFMCREGIVLGHKISKSGIQVDIAKVDVIAMLPHPTTIKGVRSFIGHAGKKLLTSSKLAMRDLLGAIMVPISQRRSDRGTHFYNDQFTKVMINYGVTHRLATAYHPQTSGQVEVSNRGLKQILKRLTAGDHRKLQLNELSELRDQAYENSMIYKERTKKLHDSKIKNSIFNVGDQVLLFNSRVKIFSGKLKTRWSGPFTITRVFPYGTIELSQPNGPNFKVNGHHVKHYFDGDIPSNVALDLHTFLMDNEIQGSSQAK